MYLKLVLSALLVLTFAVPFNAGAGSFGVVPIKVLLGAQKKTESLKITNQAPEGVTLQVKAMEWLQDKDGNDLYQPTKDLVYFPRVFSLEGKETRTVKLGLKSAASAKEKSYRIFIEEIPDTKKRTDNQALRIILKMSIPVFVKPVSGPAGKGEIESISLTPKNFSVLLKNSGNTHFLIKSVKASGIDISDTSIFFPDKKGWYLLEGASRSYGFDITPEQCRKLKELNIEIETENYTLKEKHSVNTKMCEG